MTDFETLFDSIRSGYLKSVIPEDKIQLEKLLHNSNKSEDVVDKELIIGNLKFLSD